MLIDIVNMAMADQMYLNHELTNFLSEQPKKQLLAIYLRAGSGCFLVQNFTSSRKLLLNAVRRAIPRLPPLGPQYLRDFDTLVQVAVSLGQLPVAIMSSGSPVAPRVFFIPTLRLCRRTLIGARCTMPQPGAHCALSG